MSEPSTTTTLPWLGIAVGIGIAGIAVIAALASIEPPPPPSPPQLVQHVQPDLGGWEPFAADVGAADATQDAP